MDIQRMRDTNPVELILWYSIPIPFRSLSRKNRIGSKINRLVWTYLCGYALFKKEFIFWKILAFFVWWVVWDPFDDLSNTDEGGDMLMIGVWNFANVYMILDYHIFQFKSPNFLGFTIIKILKPEFMRIWPLIL